MKAMRLLTWESNRIALWELNERLNTDQIDELLAMDDGSSTRLRQRVTRPRTARTLGEPSLIWRTETVEIANSYVEHPNLAVLVATVYTDTYLRVR